MPLFRWESPRGQRVNFLFKHVVLVAPPTHFPCTWTLLESMGLLGVHSPEEKKLFIIKKLWARSRYSTSPPLQLNTIRVLDARTTNYTKSKRINSDVTRKWKIQEKSGHKLCTIATEKALWWHRFDQINNLFIGQQTRHIEMVYALRTQSWWPISRRTEI